MVVKYKSFPIYNLSVSATVQNLTVILGQRPIF